MSDEPKGPLTPNTPSRRSAANDNQTFCHTEQEATIVDLRAKLKGLEHVTDQMADALAVDTFWMVHRVGCVNQPTRDYHTSEEAQYEAERFALKNPGEIFIVLEAKEACRAQQPVTWVNCGEVPPREAGPGDS